MLRTMIISAGLLLFTSEFSGMTMDDDKDGKTMKSKNYRIEWSTTSIGVARMRSQRYQLQGTLGQIAIDKSSSKNYRLQAGFWPVAARKLRRIEPRPPS